MSNLVKVLVLVSIVVGSVIFLAWDSTSIESKVVEAEQTQTYEDRHINSMCLTYALNAKLAFEGGVDPEQIVLIGYTNLAVNNSDSEIEAFSQYCRGYLNTLPNPSQYDNVFFPYPNS